MEFCFVCSCCCFLQFCCFQSLLTRKCDLLSSATYNTESNNVHLIDCFWNTVPYLLIMKHKIRLYDVTTFNIFVVAQQKVEEIVCRGCYSYDLPQLTRSFFSQELLFFILFFHLYHIRLDCSLYSTIILDCCSECFLLNAINSRKFFCMKIV